MKKIGVYLTGIVVVASLVLGMGTANADPIRLEDAIGPDTSVCPPAPPVTAPFAMTYYTDRPTFDTDNPGLPIEDFEEAVIAPGGVAGFGAPLNDLSSNAYFSPGDILSGITFQNGPIVNTIDGLVLLGAGFMGNPTKNVAANYFTDYFEIVFTGGNVHAVGMDLQAYMPAGIVDISIYGIGDVLLDSTTAAATNAGSFWGVYSDDEITRMTINSQGGGAEGCDNIAFGSGGVAPPPVAPVGGFSETIGAIGLLAPYILTIIALAGVVALSVVYTKRKTE
jgi:hypothetical protein